MPTIIPEAPASELYFRMRIYWKKPGSMKGKQHGIRIVKMGALIIYTLSAPFITRMILVRSGFRLSL
jgi:hypothetical protein